METPDTSFVLMLGRLEGKVDALLSNQARSDRRLDDIEGRLTQLETLRAQGTGLVRIAHLGWVFVAAVAGLFAEPIKDFFLL